MPVLSDNHRGALLMAGAMVAFTLNDTCIKSLSGALPLMQVLALRGVAMVVFLGAFAVARGMLRPWPTPRDLRLVGLRTVAEVVGTTFFLVALFNMEIANVFAIMQSLPLAVTLAAALVLREPVGWRRLSAILVGFAGVLLIVRPGGEGFTIHSLFVVVTVICVTVRDLSARRLSPEVPSVVVALAAAVGITAFGFAGSAVVAWRPVTAGDAALILLAVAFLIAGYIMSVAAMRVGEVGAVAPFRYTSLLAAIVLGAVVFGTFPDAVTLAGATLVVGSGLFTIYRERRLRRAGPAAAGAG